MAVSCCSRDNVVNAHNRKGSRLGIGPAHERCDAASSQSIISRGMLDARERNKLCPS